MNSPQDITMTSVEASPNHDVNMTSPISYDAPKIPLVNSIGKPKNYCSVNNKF